MEAQDTQREQKTRSRRSRWFAKVAARLAFAVLLVFAWRERVPLATRLVRSALDRQGFSDATFRITRLSLGCVALEDIRLGKPEPVLAIDGVDVRFSCPDVLRGEIDRVRVRGVKTVVVVDGGRLVSPLQQRLASLLSRQAQPAQGASPAQKSSALVAIGELSVYGVEIPVRLANGDGVAALRADASLFSEPDDRRTRGPVRYRFSARVEDDASSRLRVDGSLVPDTGAITLNGDVKLARVETLLQRARRVAPDRMAALTFCPSNCSFAVRGSVSLTNWTNAGLFDVTAELGRGSAFTFAQPEGEGWVRFQSLRVEASGTPQDAQGRLNVGVSGFRLSDRLQAQQEETRLLSLRGSARLLQTATNRSVRATIDSDLPGRSVMQVLPRVLPLVTRLLSDGGTLHVETDLQQPPAAAWQGEVRYSAEARRSTVTVPVGRMGAGRVTLEGSLAIRETRPQELRTNIGIEDGYYVGNGLSIRGGGQLSLASQPPYASASGSFGGQVGENTLLPKCGVVLSNSAVRFEGEAKVTGLVTNPVWQLALRVPAFGLGGRAGAASWRAEAGGAANVNYGLASAAVDGTLWLNDVAWAMDQTGKAVRVEAGLGRLDARIGVPLFARGNLSNALAQVTLSASNGWMRAGDRAVLEDAQAAVPFAWSLASGIVFQPGQALSWKRLEVMGVRAAPSGFAWAADGKTVCVSGGVRVAESRCAVAAQARIPLDNPQQTEVAVALPETELTADDGLAALVRKMDPQAEVTGRVAAEAGVRFLGKQPQVEGRVRVSDVSVRRGNAEIRGLAADVPFEAGLDYRTIRRPVITFAGAKVGNVRLDQGRIEFQVTPQEVFIDRAEVGWCKGSLNAYSIHLDPKHPKADIVVYADRIDLGEALMMVMPFKGVMEGVLYGRFPVGIDNRHVKLSKGFLYSLPGQGGKLRLEDTAPVVSLLDQAGIKGDVQQPLSKALSDMDFSAIRMELEPKDDGEAVLRMKLDGKSNLRSGLRRLI